MARKRVEDMPYVGTIGEVARLHFLHIDCRGCGHSALSDLAAAIAKYGPDLPLDSFARRSKCTGCGRVGAQLQLAPKRAGPGGA